MAARPVVDGLEKEHGRRIRFVRMDVATPAGRKVALRVGLDMVPTFVGYDGQGNERWRSQRANRGELARHLASLQ